ncbi:MAG: beta-lactamase family protein [Candidatus Eremiobacteraeota bacterium]|nr:beta-lactamase family protein [Candidatus Eremiobacteraeota bacterium]
MTPTLSRGRFTALLGGLPLLLAATANAAAIERILRRLVESGAVPAIAYSLGDGHTTLLEGAFGLRDVALRLAMEPSTRCALASVSKQFAAAAIYLLQQRGALGLEAPLSNYLPDYAYARDMTLAQVLTMRAGVAADDAACETPVGGRIDGATLIRNLNLRKLDFTPGRYFAYTNCGYDVLGIVVARVSGMSYASFLAKNIFGPLGMTSSYVLLSRRDANFAHGYEPDGSGWKAAPATAADAAFASGNLVSTVGDMQRWNRSLLGATLLTRETLRRMFTVPTVAGAAHTHYASGWFVEPTGVVWHGGTLAGYGTVNMLIPVAGYAITLLANTGPSRRWKPEETAREAYNAAALGPPIPQLLKRTRSTAPSR